MNTELKTMSENEDAANDVELRLDQALQALLAPMAARQVTAREAYGAMTRVVARIEGDMPTGARLVGLLQRFNSRRPAGVPPIPAGTAGVAQECVAAYRRTLVRASTAGVANPALPPDMVEGLNRWLERLLELMRDEIRRPYEAEAARLRASLDEEMAALRQATDAEVAVARQACQALEAELQQTSQQLQALQLQIDSQLGRIGELDAAQEKSERENRDLASSLAVQRSRVEEAQRQQQQSAQALQQAHLAADEERRQRLLALDSTRVVEQELAREKERRKAAETQARGLEKYLEEEKARSSSLQAALTEVQRRQTAEPTPAERMAQNRLKPARRTGVPAAPLRRKTLR